MKTNLLTVIALVLVIAAFGEVSCGSDKAKDNGNKQESALLATNNNTPTDLGKVMKISSVGSRQPGKFVNFSWKENGKDVSFADYTKNKVVFLNFWATWCGPCKMEIPEIIDLYKEMKLQGVIFMGIALESNDPEDKLVEKISKFVESKSINYMNFIGNEKISNAYGGIRSIPTTMIIDKEGNVIETIVGARDKATFKKALERAMK
jgi:thiol-disulfide isomerase/thioredoxin